MVEMEAAALFAVGRYRKADVAALMSISDMLSITEEVAWKPKFHLRRTLAGLEKVYRVAVGALEAEATPAGSRRGSRTR